MVPAYIEREITQEAHMRTSATLPSGELAHMREGISLDQEARGGGNAISRNG
jgi:hypothetical protein